MSDRNEIYIPTTKVIAELLHPLFERLESIEKQLLKDPKAHNSELKFYRNDDIKKIFGISNNTIIKYREQGVLPFTRIGDIYLYKVSDIEEILKRNYFIK